MLNKPFALGLIAVGLIIAPGTALADVIINNNQQSTMRNGAAVSESVNTQRSQNTSIQGGTRNGLKVPTSRPEFCSPYKAKQQGSTRVTKQSGSYVNNSLSRQTNNMARRQIQKTHATLCRKLPN